jgi:hypothetical protein
MWIILGVEGIRLRVDGYGVCYLPGWKVFAGVEGGGWTARICPDLDLTTFQKLWYPHLFYRCRRLCCSRQTKL